MTREERHQEARRLQGAVRMAVETWNEGVRDRMSGADRALCIAEALHGVAWDWGHAYGLLMLLADEARIFGASEEEHLAE